MSVRTDVINLNININGNAAQNKLNDLRKKSADLNLELKGLTKGTAEWINKSKELSAVNGEIDKLKKSMGLAALSQKELMAELRKLKALKGSVQPFSDEFRELSRNIREVEDRLYDVQNGVQGFASFFSKIKDEVKQFGLMAIAYLGFEFISSQFTSILQGAGKLSDQLADLRRVAGLTAEEADNLNKSLGKVDTRTSVSALRDIAVVAGKLGVAKADILGFTEEVDKLVVALGDELGDADAITTSLGKILNVFDGKVNGDNISKLGNAIVELANAGVASGGFISDFTQRVSGIAVASNLSLGSTVGLAAGFEELGLRSESSATALQKLLSTVAGDIPAAAKIAGMEVQEFNTLFSKSPQEALIKYAEGLTKNKESFSEITSSFKDAGEEGARVVQTLQAIGQRGEFLREKITLGNESIKDSTAINEAFALKNETLGGSLEKLGKEFAALTSSSAVTNFLKGAVEGSLKFIGALQKLPKWIEENRIKVILLVAGLTLHYRALLLSIAATIRNTVVTGANTVAVGLATAVNSTYRLIVLSLAAAKALLTGNTTRAAAATSLLSKAFMTTPIGWVVAGITALVVVYESLFTKVSAVTTAQKANALVQEKYTEELGNQERTVKRLSDIAANETFTLTTRKMALQELIKINPAYRSALNGEIIDITQLNKVSNEYLNTLRTTANAKARAAAAEDISKEIARMDAEIAKQEVAAYNEENGGKSIGGFIKAIGRGFKKEVDVLADMKDARTDLVKQQDYLFKGTETQIKGLDTQIANYTKKLREIPKELRQTGEALEIQNKLNEALKLQSTLVGGSYNPFAYGDEAKAPGGGSGVPASGGKKKDPKVKKKVKEIVDDFDEEFYRQFLAKKDIIHLESIFKPNDPDTLQKIEESANAIVDEFLKNANDAIRRKKATLELNTMVTRGKAKRDADVKLLEFQRDEELKSTELLEEEKEVIRERYRQKIIETNQEFTVAQIQEILNYTQQALGIISQFLDMKSAKENAAFNREVKQNDLRRKSFKQQLDSKLISQSQYDKKISELDAQQDQKKRELEIKQFERNKKIQIVQALINGAMGITSVLAARPGATDVLSLGAFRAINIAATVIATAAQVATIAKSQPPSYGDGGLLTKGDKHSNRSGGISAVDRKTGRLVALVERNEAILSSNTMDDGRQHTVSGTARQISSYLNGANGGATWAAGARVIRPSWVGQYGAAINNRMPAIMADGGMISGGGNSGGSNNNAGNDIMMGVLGELKAQREAINNWNRELHAVVSIKEYRNKEQQYEDSRRASGLG